MTNLQKIQAQLNIYGYSISSVEVFNQIKSLVKKATYKNSDVYVQVNVAKYQSIGIRVHVQNTRKFEVS